MRRRPDASDANVRNKSKSKKRTGFVDSVWTSASRSGRVASSMVGKQAGRDWLRFPRGFLSFCISLYSPAPRAQFFCCGVSWSACTLSLRVRLLEHGAAWRLPPLPHIPETLHRDSSRHPYPAHPGCVRAQWRCVAGASGRNTFVFRTLQTHQLWPALLRARPPSPSPSNGAPPPLTSTCRRRPLCPTSKPPSKPGRCVLCLCGRTRRTTLPSIPPSTLADLYHPQTLTIFFQHSPSPRHARKSWA